MTDQSTTTTTTTITATTAPDGRMPRLGQSGALLPSQCGASMLRGDGTTTTTDTNHNIPFQSLHEIISFAAASEKQFLNMIGSQIERDLRTSADDMENSLANIGHSKTVLDEHLRCSLDTLDQLREIHSGDDVTAAAAVPLPPPPSQSSSSSSSLMKDYSALVSETRSLIRRCVEGSDLMINIAMLRESRDAVEQNRRVGRLTFLAFFFIPASFVGTFFGMNFEEFGQGDLNLWIGGLSMVLSLVVSGMLCFYDQLLPVYRRVAGPA